MMINKRLINMVEDSKKYIAANVLIQWINLLANILAMSAIAVFIQKLYENKAVSEDLMIIAGIFIAVITVRVICEKLVVKMTYLASHTVKEKLREIIYKKLLKLGVSYNQQVKSSEVVQVAVEGVEQLETYFGQYLPQFFFSMLAPVTLFGVLSFVSISSAIVLLVCVPLIPITIVIIQKWAKKLLSKYWGQYTALGDNFLENLQGLTTLKIYQTDEMKNEEMNIEAEKFRKITMRVLTMQLNSITVMDLVTYGGTALGMILAVMNLKNGEIPLSGCILIILLSADFFIPMRRLGSFFHIAMNGMAACDKIFKLIDLPEKSDNNNEIGEDKAIYMEKVSFSYEKDRTLLREITVSFEPGKFNAIVGKSGCGKSTIAGLIIGKNQNYQGSIKIGGIELNSISEESLMKNITLVNHNSYLFKGTVRENLLMGKPDADDEELTEVLKKVKLYGFLQAEGGLDTLLKEKGSNFSGGQCQRLALARALLHNTPIYIFDEATSNIDAESEEAIMEQIEKLAETKTVIMISHRLANVAKAKKILVLEDGNIVEQGTMAELIEKRGVFEKLYKEQKELENYGKGGMNNE